MPLRKGITCRGFDRPYVRKSRKKSKSYIKTSPHRKIVRFRMGTQKDYAYKVSLIAKQDVQVRDNALEAARITINRFLEKELGKNNFFTINVFPHQIIREHKVLAGAQADRMQEGMKHSFGKPVSVAARIKANTPIITLNLGKQAVPGAKAILKIVKPKFPCECAIKVEENKTESKQYKPKTF